MALESLHLKKEFEIRQLTSLHYFEYKSDFIFKSEYHRSEEPSCRERV